MRIVRKLLYSVLLGLMLVLGACGERTITNSTTPVTNPSPAPSSPLEPSRTTDRTVAPNETSAPVQTTTPAP